MRHFIRHPTDIPIEYNMLDGSAVFGTDNLKDIGQGGLCFQAEHSLDPRLTIRIKIPITKPVFEVEAVVVWCHSVDGHYDVGIRFRDPETHFNVRMIEQICYIEQYKKQILKKESRRLSNEEAAKEWIEKYARDFPK